MLNSIRWQNIQQLPTIPDSNPYKSWLLDKGSLTTRLIAASADHFSVKLLSQLWQRPLLDEALQLHIKPRQVAIVREVLLLCHNEPWVYARTVIPLETTTGKLGYLKCLKEKSLGAALFKNPNLERSNFEVARILTDQQPPLVKESAKNSIAYGRRSLFSLTGKQILVAEVFLPPCIAHNQQLTSDH